MKRLLHGVNGIRDDGSATTDAALSEISRRHGYDTHDVNYPRVGLLHSLFGMRKVSRGVEYDRAEYLLKALRGNRVNDVIAHSFGCLATLRAMEKGARLGIVIWIAPAMESDFIIPAWACERLFVIHCPDDRALKLGSRLWFHDFGRMGLDGAASAEFDARIENICVDLPAEDYQSKTRHSYAFNTDEALAKVAELYHQAVQSVRSP